METKHQKTGFVYERVWPAVWIVLTTLVIVFSPPLVTFAALFVVAMVAFLELKKICPSVPAPHDTKVYMIGVLLFIWPTTMTFIYVESGQATLVMLIASIFVADTLALLGGKKFGKHQLAPSISPNKTWEGLGFEFAGVWLTTAVCSVIADFSVSLAQLLLVMSIVAICGVAGDLLESSLKRSARVKDSGTFLRGHGGMLDRIDSLLTAGLAMSFLVVFNLI